MTQAAKRRERDRSSLLRNLVLSVHERRTHDDKVAEEMLRKLINDVCPETELEMVSVNLKGRKIPWLFAGDSLFSGVEGIESFTRLARDIAR